MKGRAIHLAIINVILLILLLIVLFYRWPGSYSLLIEPEEEGEITENEIESRNSENDIFESENRNENEQGQISENSKEADNHSEDPSILFKDEEYGIQFSVNSNDPECTSFYDVKIGQSENSVKAYDIYVPGSESWLDPNSKWYTYHFLTQETYDSIDPNEMPGLPRVIFELREGLLLTAWDAQDGPSEITENCLLNVEKL